MFSVLLSSVLFLYILQVFGGFSLTEFNMRWKGWQNESACKLQAGTFASRKELELIIKV
jgi:hypothetical protein